ncbi:GerMN domain-containing protein [Domibacillus epiphyticus]|uniref:GerMN domain-containing protein n=1 Tax=Domibacillus epiphyticus TaxID=1714355 RepID=UPI001300D076|nr:GerMN domain-containing protein [Domibacillus epiphyticus]
MRVYEKTLLAAAVLVMSGCSYSFGNDSETDALPKRVVYTEAEVDRPASAIETIMAELYVIDQANLVVPQSMPIEKTENEEKAALQYLIEGEFAKGFRAPLPEGTVVDDVAIEGNTAVVKLSGSFKNYAPEDEANIAAAITWTVTGFGKADRVHIETDGKRLQTMPVGGMPIPEAGMKREDGINMDADYVNSGVTKPLTVYFTAQNENGPYYVPVTRRISADTSDLISAAVLELSKGPEAGKGLTSEFMAGTKLVKEPSVKNGRAVLHFNEAILENNGEPLISSRVLKPLAFTLTESAGIESFAIQVEGKPNIQLETGEQVPSSITAPLFVNEEMAVSAE